MRIRKLVSSRLDWDAVAGVVAASLAIILHLLHLVEEDVVLTITLVLLALLLFRDLRRENRDDELAAIVERLEGKLDAVQHSVGASALGLIGPGELRRTSERFARQASGEMVWFNVCLSMFRPQALFDSLLKPAIENPDITSIQFVLDESERERWATEVVPKAARCAGFAKLREPRWTSLREPISFILAATRDGKSEAQLSFWGEPFMAQATGQQIPRYVLHVPSTSELLPRLAEIERMHRVGAES
ncbi:MAG: hypothetical protein ACKVVT_03845 [Dehalococcoidia bacterium]